MILPGEEYLLMLINFINNRSKFINNRIVNRLLTIIKNYCN